MSVTRIDRYGRPKVNFADRVSNRIAPPSRGPARYSERHDISRPSSKICYTWWIRGRVSADAASATSPASRVRLPFPLCILFSFAGLSRVERRRRRWKTERRKPGARIREEKDGGGGEEREREGEGSLSPQGRSETMRASIGPLLELSCRVNFPVSVVSSPSPSSPSSALALGIYLARNSAARACLVCHGDIGADIPIR